MTMFIIGWGTFILACVATILGTFKNQKWYGVALSAVIVMIWFLIKDIITLSQIISNISQMLAPFKGHSI